MKTLRQCHSISDLRRRARSKLPKPIFDYIDGGSDDELTLRRNSSAFDDYELLPRYLQDIQHIDLGVNVLGLDLALPFFLSPTGSSRLFHHDKELGVCRAAAQAGTLYSLSSMASTNIEEVGAATDAAKMFQIYIFKDRGLTTEFVQRSKAAGYKALCLTVDTMVAGHRERDLRNGMTIPPRLTPQSFFSYASRLPWLFHLLRQPDFKLANVEHKSLDVGDLGAMGVIEYINSQFDRSVTWDDAAWLVEQWDGPFVIKGMSSPEDARRAVDIGASAVMLSNHGGRQLEGAPAPVDCLAPVRDAVGDQLELIVDGGIRRGTHIVKALALGADACSIGRPYLYGLAAGGEAGVQRALSLLREEVERAMALLGCRSVAELGSQHIQRMGSLSAHR